MRTLIVLTCGCALSLGGAGCGEKFLDVAGPQANGNGCVAAGDAAESGCDEGLVCEIELCRDSTREDCVRCQLDADLEILLRVVRR